MPQMMPLNWLMLMITLSSIFLLFNSMNFYLYLPQSKTFIYKKNSLKLTWKW